MEGNRSSVADRIAAAKNGSEGRRAGLLESYRSYLRLLARTLIGPDLRAKIDESDVAQETLIKANERFGQFRGNSEKELAAWLRAVLTHNLADVGRRFRGAAARDIFKERSLNQAMQASSLNLGRFVAVNVSSPSERVAQRELDVILADAMGELARDHREVLVLRSLEERDWHEIAERMERGYDAVRMLWMRALESLRPRIEERLK